MLEKTNAAEDGTDRYVELALRPGEVVYMPIRIPLNESRLG